MPSILNCLRPKVVNNNDFKSVDDKNEQSIKEIAVIGAGGVAGIATLFEFLHTDKDGNSTVSTGEPAKHPFFNKLVGFEQKKEVGGTWNPEDYIKDPDIPSQDILDTEEYDNVYVIKNQNKSKPSEAALKNSSFDHPIITENDPNYLPWSKSAIYPRLYINVPEEYTRFSISERKDKSPKSLSPSFITHQQQLQRMIDFSMEHSLKDYIRFNTEVYNVRKEGKKWVLIMRASQPDGKDQWYQESFDAVVLAQGSFSIPYIPHYKGLSEFNKKYPGVLLHSKAYTDPTRFKDKKVVIVGSNISAVDIGQYLIQNTKETVISRNLEKEPYLDFMARCIKSFRSVPSIEEFLPETSQIKLINGELLNDIDNVIFCTGYHIELPFLEKGILNYSIPENVKHPSSNSRIKGLYQHVFNIEDPSIVFIGKFIVQTLFRNMETQAAAVAGVWSKASKLPSKSEQYAWEKERLAECPENLFHKYDIYRTKDTFFKPISALHTKNRPDPLKGVLDNMTGFEHSLMIFERLFNDFKSGKIDAWHDFKDEVEK